MKTDTKHQNFCHSYTTYITFVTKWGQTTGSSSYGFTPTGWDNQRAEYISDPINRYLLLENNNDFTLVTILVGTHSSKIYDAQLILGSNDLVFAGYSDDSNYNYPG